MGRVCGYYLFGPEKLDDVLQVAFEIASKQEAEFRYERVGSETGEINDLKAI